jgi:hypothetical protein
MYPGVRADMNLRRLNPPNSIAGTVMRSTPAVSTERDISQPPGVDG